MLKKNRGQMSLLLIILIALGLVFLAMVMNWNRVVQAKTQSQVAATTGAATLASMMASYGEYQMQTQLGGKTQVCAFTGVLAALLIIAIVVIAIVVCLVCPECAVAVAGQVSTALTALTVSLVLATATLVLQVVVIQPAITRMWNKLQQNIKTTEDRFLENGIQTALQTVVTDSEKIPDVLDYDMNGAWNVPGVAGSDPSAQVARLTFHYTARLMSMKSPNADAYNAFRTELSRFSDAAGMTEGGCGDNMTYGNSVCQYSEKAGGNPQPAITNGCGFGTARDYPYSYDPLVCAGANNPKKLVGVLGRDDSWKDMSRNTPVQPGSDQLPMPAGGETFQAKDSYGKYSDGTDGYGRLFEFLWKLHDANSAWTLNGSNTVLADKADFPQMVGQPAPNACPGESGNGIWRPGNDLYCSSLTTQPHFGPCAKFSPECNTQGIGSDPTTNPPAATCTCAMSPNKSIWYDDDIDDLLRTLRSTSSSLGPVISDSFGGFSIGDKLQELSSDVYAGLYDLVQVKKKLRDWQGMINGWTTSMSYADAGSGFCGDQALDAEIAPAVKGSLSAVINCEKYQRDVNRAKFVACQAGCAACDPATLPRQMVAVGTKDCSAGSTFLSNLQKNINLAGMAGARGDSLDASRTAAMNFVNEIDAAILKAFYYQTYDSTSGSTECPANGVPNDCSSVVYNAATPSLDFNGCTPASPPAGKVACQDRLAKIKELFETAKKKTDDPAIGPYLIYGWQSAASKGQQRGYRHLIKVEAATPKRCQWWMNERSKHGDGLAYSCGTEKFPWVKTEKKGCCKRCYTLTDTTGCVKVRVTRYDEDHSGGLLKFAGGAPLWQFLTQYPGHSAPVKGMEACFNRDKLTLGDHGAYYVPTSFMVNNDEDYGKRYGLDCKDAVDASVRSGFFTEVCAKYYLDGKKYKIKFIPCRSDKTCLGL